MTIESWDDPQPKEYEDDPRGHFCYHCGEPCSGDVTETIHIDHMSTEFAVCDNPDECKTNLDGFQREYDLDALVDQTYNELGNQDDQVPW